MSGYVTELFGYSARHFDDVARAACSRRVCPAGGTCTKLRHDGTPAGVCTIEQVNNPTPVICCPSRLYVNNNQLLKEVASDAFDAPVGDLLLVAGEPAARCSAMARHDRKTVAVFGHGMGHELALPVPTDTPKDIKNTCSIDWILVLLSPKDGLPVEFAAVEVQTIDTTGSHQTSADALIQSGARVKDTVGLNWANVRKRIFTQIVYKGQVLERESHCRKGLYYVVPKPVFENNFASLGGSSNLPTYPQRPGTITFFVYDFDPSIGFTAGNVRPLKHISSYTTGIHQLQQAFSNYLPSDHDLYFKAIRRGLGL